MLNGEDNNEEFLEGTRGDEERVSEILEISENSISTTPPCVGNLSTPEISYITYSESVNSDNDGTFNDVTVTACHDIENVPLEIDRLDSSKGAVKIYGNTGPGNRIRGHNLF